MGFKRSHHRAEFDSSLTTAALEQFVDDFYKECDQCGVDGLIIELDGSGVFILEGDESDVNDAIGYLDSASELSNNETYLTESSGPVFNCLASHIQGDARESSC